MKKKQVTLIFLHYISNMDNDEFHLVMYTQYIEEYQSLVEKEILNNQGTMKIETQRVMPNGLRYNLNIVGNIINKRYIYIDSLA